MNNNNQQQQERNNTLLKKHIKMFEILILSDYNYRDAEINYALNYPEDNNPPCYNSFRK